jgi:hypothetical protein
MLLMQARTKTGFQDRITAPQPFWKSATEYREDRVKAAPRCLKWTVEMISAGLESAKRRERFAMAHPGLGCDLALKIAIRLATLNSQLHPTLISKDALQWTISTIPPTLLAGWMPHTRFRKGNWQRVDRMPRPECKYTTQNANILPHDTD